MSETARGLAYWRRALTLAVTGALAPGVGCAPPTPPAFALEGAAVRASLPALDGAAYYAFLQPVSARDGFGGATGPIVAHEGGLHRCAGVVGALQQFVRQRHNDVQAVIPSSAECPEKVADVLVRHAANGERLVVIQQADGSEVTLTKATLGPVTSPEAALVAVWLDGRHSVAFPVDGEFKGGLDAGYARAVAGGFEVVGSRTDENQNCGGPSEEPSTSRLIRAVLRVTRAGAVEVTEEVVVEEHTISDGCHPLGRRPEDFVDVRSGGTLQGYLRRAMHHEAESVRAFSRLARELAASRAPSALVRGATHAAADERRHAHMFAELLAEAGCATQPVFEEDDLPVRDVRACAIENAVEGCVMETYAAMVAVHQSRQASTARLRAHFAAIARDELEHAALAWACHEHWLRELPTQDAARVEGAQKAAVDALGKELATTPPVGPDPLGQPARQATHACWMAVASLGGHLAQTT